MQPLPLFLVLVIAANSTAFAQQRFRLVAPQARVASDAVLNLADLTVIDGRGQTTIYLRDSQFDSPDGAWFGYYDRRTSQVIRWPASSTGNLQIGDVAGNTVRYRTSQMVIEPLDRVANRPPVLPPPMNGPGFNTVDPLAGITPDPLFNSVFQNQRPQSQMLQMANIDARGTRFYLSHDRFNVANLSTNPHSDSHWWVVPAGNQLVRIHHYENGRVSALTANRRNSISLAPLNQDPRQLWHISTLGNGGGQFILENATYHGMCMSNVGGQLRLEPVVFSPTQLWVPLTAPVAPDYQPFWRTVSQEMIPNSPLPPAQLSLVNTHRNALFVLLGDQRGPGKVQQIRIEPNQTATLTLERDAGATLIETYEIRSTTGIWDRQQFTTAIPAKTLYDISVYEEFLQSIAIDRTGKSPIPIEDVNYMPKSVGWLLIPPGARLPQSSSMNVLEQARAANNPGAVRRMDMKQFEKPKADPLESILDEFKTRPRRGF
jgi:hypothetical protein